ncbi:probable methyltransferase PMT26 [Diospyros lotus]|uniref:probable methyltransferase PMT26 n=1 Tax=Diospyros lotus TaxID=55363 RepID=UPI00225736AF|nr:probable methyltransferase PMT26 [Diospyros lotus]
MALGKYSRVDGRKSSSSYCSTVTLVVFVALCLVGVWMMTSSSVVPVQNADVASQEKKNQVKEQANESNESTVRNENNESTVSNENNESNPKQFEDNPGDLPEDATKGDTNVNSAKEENNEPQENKSASEKTSEDAAVENEEEKLVKKEDETKFEDVSKTETENHEAQTEDGESKAKNKDSEAGDTTTDSTDDNSSMQQDSDEGSNEKKGNLDENEKKSEENSNETKDGQNVDGQIEEKVDQNEDKESDQTSEKKKDGQAKDLASSEVFPSGAQSELLNETTTQTGAWATQATESKNEKEAQTPSKPNWKLCNVTAGPDYIPCLDNWQAIRSLRSTKHYEHRERHCPEEPPTCLVPLPEGYQRPIEWPTSREKIWYHNVPHTKLAQIKGHQNWVKVSGDYLTFPGGGTQFKNGALHYIDVIQQAIPDIAWGKRTRVVLDVGCGVASFGGFLFERDVLTMSFAPKDEHEAQVQFALERGIPAISAVMGTKRLQFPGRVFDVVHCARCRVPWHIEGGKLLLELNRVLRPGGFFIWSATPIYQKLPDDVAIWQAMKELTKSMCWEVVSITRDTVNGVGIAVYQKPTTNECYEKRTQNVPPVCQESDDPNAAWNVPLQACMHKIPVVETERGSKWPKQWPARVEQPPYWLLSSQVGVYGKAAPEDFTADYQHWKRVVAKSYLTGMGINWSSVRNVMDMKAIYGGFAAALRDLKVWVMNVVPIDSPDTLPIIYERGLFGMYHDWCESFSTYPRSYDLLHADHLFSKVKKRCNLVAVVAEVDRILRPEGKLIVRDKVEIINEVESLVKAMHWEVRLTYSKDKEGILCVQKTVWRPTEVETVAYAIA